MASILRPDFKHSLVHGAGARTASKQTRRSGKSPPGCRGALPLACCCSRSTSLPAPTRPISPPRMRPAPCASKWLMATQFGATDRVFVLVGFNTPEFGLNAQCSSERALAAKATDRLQQLLAKGEPNLQRVACACDPGTEGTRRCNHGRLCGRLTVDGRDVGSILIAEGLAERFECGATSCPRRKNWCRS